MKTIFDLGTHEDNGYQVPVLDVPEQEIAPVKLLRALLDFPMLPEPEVVRHYTYLSTINFGVDNGFYPLGSCTMKYNPKINEDTAALPGFSSLHPALPETHTQGALELMFELEQSLKEISGMAAVTLQPAAGSQGEFAGVLVMKHYFASRGETRCKILIPDSAHGTNPATVSMAGLNVEQIKTNDNGTIHIDDLKKKLGPDVAGIMITNPNTLGLFEENILDILRLVHEAGGLAYCDGANLNATMGVVRPGDLGFDILHFNLHKTFSTPHGCGGPGAGPIGVKEYLSPFLPNPRIVKTEKGFNLVNSSESVGRLRSFYGNFGILVRAYTFILGQGVDGLTQATEIAVLNANYLKEKLKPHFHLKHDRVCMHEFVLDDSGMPNDVTTNDIAKRLLDYGFHAPTIYFPLIIPGAIMIEPTETETKERLDEFVDAMLAIKKEAEATPDKVKKAPWHTAVRRVDAVKAAREVNINHCPLCVP